MKHILLGVAVVTMMMLGVPHVRAATYLSNPGGAVTVSESPTNKPLYVSGETVVLGSNLNTDVFVAASTLKVNREVSESVFAMSSLVTIDADVHKGVRVLSGDTTINGDVTEDVSVAGGKTTISKTGRVHGDVQVIGGQLEIDGVVDGSVYYAGSSLTINGLVQGNVLAASSRVIVSDTATVAGYVTYDSKYDAQIAPGAVKGTITHHQNAGGFGQFSTIIYFATQLLSGVILILLFGAKITKISSTLLQHATRNSLVGLLFVIVIPVLVMVLSMTIIALPLALTILSLYLMVLYFASIIAATVVGRLLLSRFHVAVSDRIHPYLGLVVGLLLWIVIRLIPVFGPIMLAVIWLTTVGAIVVFDVELFSILKQKREL